MRVMNDDRRTPNLRDIWKLILAIIGVIAVIQELRKPSDEREWHGTVGFFPYDFRMPTIGRIKETYWDPDGSLLSGKVFGVGWAPNFGAMASWFTSASEDGAETPDS
jgi:hypothetical protein